MTIEEAIEIMNRPFNMKHTPKEILEAHKMAIEVLEKEPCEDCISRQEAIDAVIDLCRHYTPTKSVNHPHVDFVIEALQKLPSVTQKENTGYWIDDADKIDAQFGRHTYKCSECGKYAEYFVSGTGVWWDRIKPNYCPYCGARMVSE